MISPGSVKRNWIYHLENYCQSIMRRRRFCSQPCYFQLRKTFVLQWWLPNFTFSAIRRHGKKACFNLLSNSLHFVVAITSRRLHLFSMGCTGGVCVWREKGMDGLVQLRDQSPQTSSGKLVVLHTCFHFTTDPQTMSSAPHCGILFWWEHGTWDWFLPLLLFWVPAVVAPNVHVKIMKDWSLL